jgi:hypothetical protein
VPLSLSLPGGLTLLFNSEIDGLKDSTDNGRHANFINLAGRQGRDPVRKDHPIQF